MSSVVAFVTHESPWFPAGGIAAVMGQLPSATEAATRLPTVVITPFHERSPKIAGLQMENVHVLTLSYDGATIRVLVTRSNAGCPWYFLRPDGAPVSQSPFFAGARHPFDVPKEVLLRDSLFFGAASVKALPAIASHQGVDPDHMEWNLVAQD